MKRRVVVIAKTIREGEKYIADHIDDEPDTEFEVYSTSNSIRGMQFGVNVSVFVLTRDPEILENLIYSLDGARVYFTQR